MYSFVAYDVDDLADNVIAEKIMMIIGFWEITRMRNKYHSKERLKMLIEGMGADPERESETRASYSPENVYD